MRYVVQRRNALGGLEWLDESSTLNGALRKVKAINRNRERCYKLYPAYIYDTVEECVYTQRNTRGYFCVFVGGSSYSIGNPEYFRTVKAIKDALWRRLNDQRMYPCLDDDACFECYSGQMSDCPDFIIKVGPRGGILKESC